MIDIQNLYVNAGEKEILKGVSLTFEKGKNYVLLGKNGSGKSTLASTLAGNPKYSISSGVMKIDGEEMNILSPDIRSRKGIFLSFQNVPEIQGISLAEYLRTIYNIHHGNEVKDSALKAGLSPFLFKRFVKKYLEELHIPESFLERDLNVGFSGGEKRKIEILQMKLINPSYIILDEIDSGLDLDAFRKVAELLQKINSENNSLIIITHYFSILDYIDVDEAYVLRDGQVKSHGGKELIEQVKKDGYG